MCLIFKFAETGSVIRHFPNPALLLQFSSSYWDESNIFNLLIVLVFGFSSLNILGLVTRPFEQRRTRLSFGEILAITAMFVSIGFLAMEFLHVYHIFPIKLQR